MPPCPDTPRHPFNLSHERLQQFYFFSKINENCLHLRYAGFKKLDY